MRMARFSFVLTQSGGVSIMFTQTEIGKELEQSEEAKHQVQDIAVGFEVRFTSTILSGSCCRYAFEGDL